jgi:hypothetical protein
VPALLDDAIAAAGGAERWERIGELTAHVRSGGLLLATRARRGALRDYELRVSAHEPRAVFEAYPAPGRRGVFEPGEVRIEDDAGRVLARRADPRAAFKGSLRRQFRWDDLDLAYFAGYAMWNYLTTPFLLARPGFEVREEGGRRLVVRFPPDVPTHSREQVFHFDAEARLVRHDYHAEVIGPYARAAHLCAEHRDFDGLVVPTRRRVVPRRRGGGTLPGPTLVSIAIDRLSAS